MEPVHVIVVHDDISGHQGLYVGGELKTQDSAIYGCDIATFTEGLAITVSFVTIEMPNGVPGYPDKFDQRMLWAPVIDGQGNES